MSDKSNNKRKWTAHDMVFLIACAIIFTITGVLVSLFCSNPFCIVTGFILGMVMGIVIIIFYPYDSRSGIDFMDENDKEFIKTLDDYAKQCYCEVRMTYYCRRFAAKRLMRNEFWIQTINIYYSVFTAILAVFSLTPNSDFVQIPSVLFTITVAILVTYANAQKCESRSKDLAANCTDLGNTYTEIVSLISSNEYIKDNSVSHEKLKNQMDIFYSNLGDSESHSTIDEWRYTNSWLFYLYIVAMVTFVYILFAIPIGFIGVYHTKFIEIFKGV